MSLPSAEIGVFGGSGFYEFLEDVEYIPVHTPYGAPSAPIALGKLDGENVAFLARHGAHHEVPAHVVNYRANIWAMREIGVRQIVGPCAGGSLRPEMSPGDVVILDQFVDRTSGRRDTYFNGGSPGHISMADPYCPEMADLLVTAGTELGLTVHGSGTVVVVQGPRFSTKAESQWFKSAGWDVVNMTQYPEIALARELGMCYSGIAVITDYDAGIEGHNSTAVQMADVFEVLRANVQKTQELLMLSLPMMMNRIGCTCRSTIDSGPLEL